MTRALEQRELLLKQRKQESFKRSVLFRIKKAIFAQKWNMREEEGMELLDGDNVR